MAIVVFSARFELISRGKMVLFHIQTKSSSPDKLVHQMATHLSYPHANLEHVTVAKLVKHPRPVLEVDVKSTPGSVKTGYLCLIMEPLKYL